MSDKSVSSNSVLSPMTFQLFDLVVPRLVAVWAFQITDDPAVLDFFAQRMRLNGLALAKYATGLREISYSEHVDLLAFDRVIARLFGRQTRREKQNEGN